MYSAFERSRTSERDLPFRCCSNGRRCGARPAGLLGAHGPPDGWRRSFGPGRLRQVVGLTLIVPGAASVGMVNGFVRSSTSRGTWRAMDPLSPVWRHGASAHPLPAYPQGPRRPGGQQVPWCSPRRVCCGCFRNAKQIEGLTGRSSPCACEPNVRRHIHVYDWIRGIHWAYWPLND